MSATGPVINAKPRPIPGLPVQNYLDNAALTLLLPEDGRLRTTSWIRALCFHTTKGLWPQAVLPGYGPHVDDAAKVNRYWTNNRKAGGAQFVMDRDGTGASMCDCLKVAAYHASQVNDVTQGIEIYQEADHDLYAGELDASVALADALTWFFQIQRQVQDHYVGPIQRLDKTHKGLDVVGVYGHRDVTSNRGRGDPGDHIYDYLIEANAESGAEAVTSAGYEPVDYASSTDLALWKPRQAAMNAKGASLKVDGVAGPRTVAAIQKYYPDKPRGLWIVRPIDGLLAATYGNDWSPAAA